MNDMDDVGRSGADAPSGHSGSAPSPVPGLGHSASVPNALADGLGSIVSMLADARDVYPGAETTLEAVTECVNELWSCVEDGVFGPIHPALAQEAYGEALRRYPEAARGLAFLWAASGLGWREPNSEELEWARETAQAIEARRAATAKTGAVEDESAVPEGCAQSPAP